MENRDMGDMIKVLRCPLCKSKLNSGQGEENEALVCSNKKCSSIYPVISDIPVLLASSKDDSYLSQQKKQKDEELRGAFTNLLDEDRKNQKNYKILERLSAFDQPNEFTVLDLGSGLGHTVKHLSKHFHESYGIELDFDRILSGHATGQIVCADMTQIPFANDYFDIVCCIGVVHHLADIEQYLLLINEIKRVLKNNGLLMLWEPKPAFYRGIAERFVFSPLGSFFRYTRCVKTILIKEADEYKYWLAHYDQFFALLDDNGFELNKKKWGLFKDYRVFNFHRLAV